jgi:hypothetical protein
MRRPRRRRWGWLGAVLAGTSLATGAAGQEPPPDERARLAEYDAKVTPEDREHWAFRPVRPVAVPVVRDSRWVRNPIDAFVLAQLEEKGWAPSPAAQPRALLRRLHFDLTGLPPTPEEVQAFLEDPSPEALDRVAEGLLARPSYGERWARHWLDLVRFAETNGYERDAVKPEAWKYRDYVIRSFNEDKPYDRFLAEQLAGDELPDASAETLIATGFNRLGPWDDEPADPKQDRFDQLDDLVRTTSEVFLGLTLGCARCHDHKFEPLTSLDYTRMVAVFDPLHRPQDGRAELVRPVGTRAELSALAGRDRRIDEAKAEVASLRRAFRDEYLVGGRSRLPAEAVEALKAEPSSRTEAQKALCEAHEKEFGEELQDALPDETRRRIDDLHAEIDRLRAETPDLPMGYFLEEPSPAPPATHLLHRGQASNPGPRVDPGMPAVLVASQPAFPPPGERTTGRRSSLARWLTEPDNPLTARVIVNRVWQFHFGEGIVRTPNDFGTAGAPPTHPELLDWLADRFVREGWSLKALHRLIVSSNTYRMSKGWNAEYGAEDPEDLLLWRVPYRRLEAEAIRDAMLAASGQLDATLYGPSVYPEIPREALASHSDPDKVWRPFDERAASRRTIYGMVKRSLVIPMLEVLDFCDTAQSSPRRSTTSIAPQALTLLNGGFVNRQAHHLADRLVREAGDDPTCQVRRAYWLALSRPATEDEAAAMVAYLGRESDALRNAAASRGEPVEEAQVRREALARMGRILFNLNEFVYPD